MYMLFNKKYIEDNEISKICESEESSETIMKRKIGKSGKVSSDVLNS